MALIRGVIPGELADVLAVEGGRVSATQLRDQEGISLVYDVGRFARGQLMAFGARQVVDVTYDDTGDNFVELANLPNIFRLLGVSVTVNSAASVQQVNIWANSFGGIGSPHDLLLWRWFTGDPTFARPSLFNVTANPNNTVLIGGIDRIAGFTGISTLGQLARQGVESIIVQGEAVSAATFELSVSLPLAFPIVQVSGPGNESVPFDWWGW